MTTAPHHPHPTSLAEEHTLPSHRSPRLPGRVALPSQSRSPARHPGLARLNAASPENANTALLACCASRRWAHRLAAHRPYQDLDTLLAAADEAAYDMTPADLTEALAQESRVLPPDLAYSAAHTALSAAHAAYESRFGHAFVLCLDAFAPEEALDHVLAGIRSRLGNDPEEERVVTADELRRLARGRLTRLVLADAPGTPGDQASGTAAATGIGTGTLAGDPSFGGFRSLR
ncbi:2-oxo-4-hydroxy-4-carboxy-5-ureidoimidazoline decarboxylase [Streptomyces sp. NPDC091292]|uniref:2-oxo-4-hydroxy-4-carboxy-5-ureidoimidazoline decarboxylase n=1 Tax=Streptomyces sp. NPDC091292 TaxID=3365991 RepID=UPI00382F67C1